MNPGHRPDLRIAHLAEVSPWPQEDGLVLAPGAACYLSPGAFGTTQVPSSVPLRY